MSDENYPNPWSDPESEGLPDVADDDSVADDSVQTGREADGPDPAQIPSDRRTVAVDRFGTTPDEQRQGESLNDRISQERPDVGPDDLGGFGTERALLAEADSEEAVAQAQMDADVMGSQIGSDPHSAISVYDYGNLDGTSGTSVGRLMEPDEGAHTDAEADSVAFDAGASGGGASAEELAIHETPPPELT
ncbi:MAG TPA: DUF5709 domain-containing protein [Micromonosporaceae bacterium]|nr:DUF5709 domain-containing protein [Micromonosporaceae bacterium]